MIDWNRVKDLQMEIGADNFTEVVDLFLEEMETELHKLGGAGISRDLPAALHFLKGGALNLGFTEFSGLCQAVETKALKDNVDVQDILSCYNRSRAAFLDGLQFLDRYQIRNSANTSSSVMSR